MDTVKIESLRAKLEKVNTQLNLIEDGWPFRPPTMSKKTTTKVDCKNLPQYAVKAVNDLAQHLKQSFPKGWEFFIYGFSWGGIDAGSLVEVFINGKCFSSVQFNLGGNIKSSASCTQKCIERLPKLFDITFARLQAYPFKTFASKKYKRLCEQRRELNKTWFNMQETGELKVTSSKLTYPYGQHKLGYPRFGMHLG